MSSFGTFLLEAAVLLIVATLIGVACLRAAIALYNRVLAGGPSSADAVPAPAFEKAVLVIFLTLALQLVGRAIVGQLVRTGTTAAGARENLVEAMENLALLNITLPVSFFALALMLTAILPTSFGRALLVSLCCLLVIVLLIGFLVGAVIILAHLT